MKLHATIRKTGDFDGPTETIETEAVDYYTALAQLAELTPAGWQRLHVRRED